MSDKIKRMLKYEIRQMFGAILKRQIQKQTVYCDKRDIRRGSFMAVNNFEKYEDDFKKSLLPLFQRIRSVRSTAFIIHV